MPANVEFVVNGRTGVEGFAQGGIYKECVSITVKDTTTGIPPYPNWSIPAGTWIYVAPALWDDNYRAKWQLGGAPDFDPVWAIEYQAIAGLYSMNLINIDAKYKNMQAKIRIFTPSQFLIEIEYLAVADTHNFLFPYTYQPQQLWIKQSVDNKKLNVYNTGNRVIGTRLSLDSDTWVQNDNYVQGSPWTLINYPGANNKYYLEANGKQVTGYVLGQDLKIYLRNFPQYTNCQYYAGIFRVDRLLGSSLHFNKEIYMQMAKANNTADEPFMYATSQVSRDKLKDFHGFRYEEFQSLADFTIDDSYFTSGARYRPFLVTIESGKYQSYLFDDFGEQADREAPEGSISCLGFNLDGIGLSLVSGCCFYEVPHGAEVSVQMQMDIASYEADLLLKGYGGAWADYFREVYCFESSGVRQMGSNPFPGSVDYQELGGQAIITWTFKIPESWQGQNKILNFAWVFDFGGETDHVIGYTTMHTHQGAATDIELKGPAPLPEVCAEDATITQFCFENPSASHYFFADLLADGNPTGENLILNKEADFSTAADGCFDFDYIEAEAQTEYCVNLRAWKQTTTGTPQPCTDLDLQIITIFNARRLEGALAGWVDADVKSIYIEFIDINGYTTVVNVANKASFFMPWLCKFSPTSYTGKIIRSDGHTYEFSGTFAWSPDMDVSDVTIEICTGAANQFCPNNPILSHSIVWNYNAGGQLPNKTITANFLNAGAPTIDTRQYRLNGGAWLAYTVPITVAPSWIVEFRWTLTYGAACTIELFDYLTEEACSIP